MVITGSKEKEMSTDKNNSFIINLVFCKYGYRAAENESFEIEGAENAAKLMETYRDMGKDINLSYLSLSSIKNGSKTQIDWFSQF